MTTTAPEPTEAAEPTTTEPTTTDVEAATTAKASVGLWLLPILVAVVVGGWAIWRATAELDDIEARQLAWSAIGRMTIEHIQLTFVSTLLVILIAIPLGILLTRPGMRAAAPVVVGVANAGQAAPFIGLIVLLAIAVGFGFWTAVLALVVYAILPVLRNTMTGLLGVDQTLVEAGRGMGMPMALVLWRIELPMAVPVIMSGVRTALVLLVGTASFGTFINAGGLGSLITTGINLFRYSILLSGGLLIAALALLIDWAGRLLEHIAQPKGLR